MPRDLAAYAGLAIGDYLAAEGRITLCHAFHVGPSGPSPWHRIERLDRRDELIRRLGRVLAPEGGAGTQAQAAAEYLARYRAARWARDRETRTCPPDLAGKPVGLCWEISRLHDRPLGPRQINNIINGRRTS